MLAEAPGSINFTMFLTLMGEKCSGTDPAGEITAAFEAFDEDGTGVVNADELREWMTAIRTGSTTWMFIRPVRFALNAKNGTLLFHTGEYATLTA